MYLCSGLPWKRHLLSRSCLKENYYLFFFTIMRHNENMMHIQYLTTLIGTLVPLLMQLSIMWQQHNADIGQEFELMLS